MTPDLIPEAVIVALLLACMVGAAIVSFIAEGGRKKRKHRCEETE